MLIDPGDLDGMRYDPVWRPSKTVGFGSIVPTLRKPRRMGSLSSVGQPLSILKPIEVSALEHSDELSGQYHVFR